jgi:hypothetical protein
MPVGILQTAPGFTKQMYEQVGEKMFGNFRFSPEAAPDGLIVHSAGPGENGWYVYGIWESREHFQRFLDEKLMPAMGEVMGDQPMPEDAQPQFFEIDNLVVARSGALARTALAAQAQSCGKARAG